MVDYCKLIRDQIEVQKIINAYLENGDEMEEIASIKTVDVQLHIPPG